MTDMSLCGCCLCFTANGLNPPPTHTHLSKHQTHFYLLLTSVLLMWEPYQCLAPLTRGVCTHLICHLFQPNFIRREWNNPVWSEWKQDCTYRVEQGHTEVLDDAVQCHELENAEWSYEGGSTLPVEVSKSEPMRKRKMSMSNVSHRVI